MARQQLGKCHQVRKLGPRVNDFSICWDPAAVVVVVVVVAVAVVAAVVVFIHFIAS